MMNVLPKDTIAYFSAAPQYHRYDLSDIPTSDFSAATKLYRTHCGMVVPTEEAISFYCLNHLTSLISKKFTVNEPLPKWASQVWDSYLTITVEQGLRLMHYVLSIAVREMRHLKIGKCSVAFWKKVDGEFGVNFSKFLKDICVAGESEAVAHYMNKPPNVPIGKFIRGLVHVFNYKSLWDGGFGGPKWGEIAEACALFITGKTSMEVLCDTGYTLAHNNAPMFNKGMMYKNQDSSQLRTILDVQRSGQIPELVLDTNDYGVEKTPVVIESVGILQAHLSEAEKFRGYVDWFLVEQLGALGHYSHYQGQQKLAHPEKVEVPKVPEIAKLFGGKNISVTGDWVYWPSVGGSEPLSVQKFERVGVK
jgi:hypothetical protein